MPRQSLTSWLPYLSWSKLKNALLLFISFLFSKYRGKIYNLGKPISIAIEPTTACNLRCPECPSGLRSFHRPTGNLDFDFLKKMVDEVSPYVFYLNFYFQGEPYINPQFLEMVSYAHKKKIFTSSSTNAHFLNDDNAKNTVLSGLDRIIISIDGTTQESYEKYRKQGKLANVIQGTKNLVSWKKKLGKKHPHIIFQFLVVKYNEHEIPQLYQLAEELGVNEVRLKTAQVYDYKNGNEFIPDNPAYARYHKQADGSYSIDNALLNYCWRLWSSPVITWDGQVVPCCFDKDADHPMGSLKTSDFTQIWRGEAYQSFRKQLLKGRKEIEICANCSEGCKVWAKTD
jgi:radical SAM protein with 4Fe4S-binding SPASM domain